MGRYRTPAGVIVSTSSEVARSAGYLPVASKDEQPKKAPAKKAASKKSEK